MRYCDFIFFFAIPLDGGRGAWGTFQEFRAAVTESGIQMKRALVTVSGILAWGLAASSAVAADIETVRAWLKKSIEEAKAGPPTMVHAKWVVTETLAGMPDLEALRREVGDKPDHPRRTELENWERLAKSGGERREIEAWWGNEHQWRISQTYAPETGSTAVDVAVAGDLLWMMTPNTLNIESLRSRPDERSWESYGSFVSNALSGTFHGGIALLASFPESEVLPGDEPDVWMVRSKDSSREAFVRVLWDNRAVRGFPAETGIRSRDPKVLDGASESWHKWQRLGWAQRPIGANQRWVAGETRVFKPGLFKPTQVYQLVGVRPLDEGELARAVAIPELGSPDISRGTVKFTAVNDYRPAVATATVLTRDGEREVPLRVTSEERGGWLRPVGWGSFAVCVLTILWVRLKSRLGS